MCLNSHKDSVTSPESHNKWWNQNINPELTLPSRRPHHNPERTHIWLQTHSQNRAHSHMKNYFSRTLVGCDVSKACKTRPKIISTWGHLFVTSVLSDVLLTVLFSPKLTRKTKKQIVNRISGKNCFGISEFKEVSLVYISFYKSISGLIIPTSKGYEDSLSALKAKWPCKHQPVDKWQETTA